MPTQNMQGAPQAVVTNGAAVMAIAPTSHSQMQAMRKGNHRRTKSTHPDELNKMMFSLSTKETSEQAENHDNQEPEESKEPLQRVKQRQFLPPGMSSSFTESSQIGAAQFFGYPPIINGGAALYMEPPQEVIVEEDESTGLIEQ